MRAPFRQYALALLASTAFSTPVFALEPSGSAVRVDRVTNADGAAGERVLEVDSDVYMGDEITTNPHGLAQIRFADDTRIVVGPNSRLVIDSFVFNPDKTARQVTVSAVKGVFRFISGNSPHEAYTIRTPTATIGIRGTVLDINARGPDSSFIFQSGGGTACDVNNVCIEIPIICQLWVAPLGGGINQATGIEARTRLAAFFPLLDNSRLDPLFIPEDGGCSPTDSRFFQTYERKSEPTSPPPPPGGSPEQGVPPPPPPDGYGGDSF